MTITFPDKACVQLFVHGKHIFC